MMSEEKPSGVPHWRSAEGVEVEAAQLTPSSLNAIWNLTESKPHYGTDLKVDGLTLYTDDQRRFAAFGDWVAKRLDDGQLAAIPDAEFRDRFAPVDAGRVTAGDGTPAPGQAARLALVKRLIQAAGEIKRCDSATVTCDACETQIDDVMAAADFYAQAGFVPVFTGRPEALKFTGHAAAAPAGPQPDCDGLCMTAAEVGVPVAGNPVAYAHPGCPAHDPEPGPQGEPAPGDLLSKRFFHLASELENDAAANSCACESNALNDAAARIRKALDTDSPWQQAAPAERPATAEAPGTERQ